MTVLPSMIDAASASAEVDGRRVGPSGAGVTVRWEASPHGGGGPVRRSRLVLGGAGRLRNSAGVDAPAYIAFDLRGGAATGVRLSEFDERAHACALVERPVTPADGDARPPRRRCGSVRSAGRPKFTRR